MGLGTARALSKLDERPSAWTLLDAELAALERLDLPLFVARADARSIFATDGQEAAEVLPERPREHLAARLRSLSVRDMAEQIMIIRCSLHDGAGEATCDCDSRTHAAMIEPATLTSDVLIDEARALADEIAARVIRAEDGSAAWIGAAFMRESRRFQLRPLDDSLDRGSTGVALFLATLASLEGERARGGGAAERHAELALAALAPLRHTCTDEAALSSLAARVGLGAGTGLGGLIYALTRCAALVDRHLLDDARTLAQQITPELIERDHELDVISGSAGAILGLLALHAATGEAEPIERANFCAAHLLAHRSLSDSGHLVWRPRGHVAQTGLSHGAAGFALALTRLHAHTGDDRQLAGAREAIAFERSAFVAASGNWLDLRPGASERCATSWCNGAPGIGLARLDLLGLPGLRDDAELLDEIAVAIKTTSDAPLAGIDTLCCGNLGRIELLICGGAQRQAQQLAAQVIGRARAEGRYRVLRDAPDGLFTPGFMSGTAGIGYQLLRLAAPERVASMLLWQPAG